jgi:flagellar hook assembly protein FlgD
VYCDGAGSSVIGVPDEVPRTVALHQKYPNPFNPTTTIAFSLPEKVTVKLSIYDVDGRLVTTLVDGVLDRGRKEYVWEGTNSGGNQVSSGIYFYRLRAGTTLLTKKMVLLK